MGLLKLYITILLTAFTAYYSHSQWNGKVQTTGAMNEMGKTNFATQVWLDTLPNKAHFYGMGPYDRMKGEITVFDGKPFYASAFEEGKATVAQSWDIRSPFFVYANVLEWESFELSGPFTGLGSIQNQVATIAQRNGYDLNNALPFKISGTFDSITTHIVTPRSADVQGYKADVKQQVFTFDTSSGSLLGFYSERHQGIFTSAKSFIHVHYISDDQTFMGHLDGIETRVKSLTLYLPVNQKNNKTGVKVNDTDFSKGRLGNIQKIELEDLAKFHGHLCDGLVVGHLALKEALLQLYPDGITDRTNTRIVSGPSPCLTDAAVYLTGGRYQFNTFYVSKALNGIFVVQRIDNHKTVSVTLNQGVKPREIDLLGARATNGELSPCQLDSLRALEDGFTQKLLESDPKNNFVVTELTNFKWNPVLNNEFVKIDILNKDAERCDR